MNKVRTIQRTDKFYDKPYRFTTRYSEGKHILDNNQAFIDAFLRIFYQYKELINYRSFAYILTEKEVSYLRNKTKAGSSTEHWYYDDCVPSVKYKPVGLIFSDEDMNVFPIAVTLDDLNDLYIHNNNKNKNLINVGEITFALDAGFIDDGSNTLVYSNTHIPDECVTFVSAKHPDPNIWADVYNESCEEQFDKWCKDNMGQICDDLNINRSSLPKPPQLKFKYHNIEWKNRRIEKLKQELHELEAGGTIVSKKNLFPREPKTAEHPIHPKSALFID